MPMYTSLEKKEERNKNKKIYLLFITIINNNKYHINRYIGLRNFNFARRSYPGDAHSWL